MMSRIPHNALLRAIAAVQKLNNEQKERLADEIFIEQPNMLASVLVLPRLGVPAEKLVIALDTLFSCFQAMKESGLTWPLITEDEQERQMQRNNTILGFYASFDDRTLQTTSLQQYIDGHPEKDLLARVMTGCRDWLRAIDPEESDKYVLQAAINLVNCLAFVPMMGGRQ